MVSTGWAEPVRRARPGPPDSRTGWCISPAGRWRCDRPHTPRASEEGAIRLLGTVMSVERENVWPRQWLHAVRRHSLLVPRGDGTGWVGVGGAEALCAGGRSTGGPPGGVKADEVGGHPPSAVERRWPPPPMPVGVPVGPSTLAGAVVSHENKVTGVERRAAVAAVHAATVATTTMWRSVMSPTPACPSAPMVPFRRGNVARAPIRSMSSPRQSTSYSPLPSPAR